jgi:aryl-alcohol dehydrogenase-like predicted oxidoreductase
VQNHYNLLAREQEREVLPYCRADDVAFVSWSSLARGWLTGNHRRDEVVSPTARSEGDPFGESLYGRSADFDVIEALIAVADQRGERPIRVALAWLLSKTSVTSAIVGLTKLVHLDDLLLATEIRLSEEEIGALEEPYAARPAGSL